MSESDPAEVVACASYTFARRHPKVLGRIGGWAPAGQLHVLEPRTLGTAVRGGVWLWGGWAPRLEPPRRPGGVGGVGSVFGGAGRGARGVGGRPGRGEGRGG